MRIYRWEATATVKGFEDETASIRGAFESDLLLHQHRAQILRQSELEAIPAAYRQGLNEETVEVVDLVLIDDVTRLWD